MSKRPGLRGSACACWISAPDPGAFWQRFSLTDFLSLKALRSTLAIILYWLPVKI